MDCTINFQQLLTKFRCWVEHEILNNLLSRILWDSVHIVFCIHQVAAPFLAEVYVLWAWLIMCFAVVYVRIDSEPRAILQWSWLWEAEGNTDGPWKQPALQWNGCTETRSGNGSIAVWIARAFACWPPAIGGSVICDKHTIYITILSSQKI